MMLIIESRNEARDTATAPGSDKEHESDKQPGDSTNVCFYDCWACTTTLMAFYNTRVTRPNFRIIPLNYIFRDDIGEVLLL